MPKLLIITSILLFAFIGAFAFFKDNRSQKKTAPLVAATMPIEIELEENLRIVEPTAPLAPTSPQPEGPKSIQPITPPTEPIQEAKVALPLTVRPADGLPMANRIDELFNLEDPKLPIVETITYKSRVDWRKGSPAWVSDYASHYNTSRHFIARSLNKKPDYLRQDVAEGNRFNVFKPGKEVEFYLVIDTSRCKMWFYYHDHNAQERVLLKTYDVSLGRPDPSKTSGLLTPLGHYTLGSRIATYKPTAMGPYKGQQVEMIRVFGTRWIPFEKEISDTTAPAKGFGIHGVPWAADSKSGQLAEDTSSLGKYESDGCIRMATDDIEEIYAIVVTKPTHVILVKDFSEAKLPGKEKR